MLALPASVRVFVASKPINMHFSFDKLAGIVRDHLGQEPMNGHLYVFFNKRADKVKILVWDRHGWSLLYKRLEAGTFKPPGRIEAAQQQVEIENVQLALILEGIDLTGAKKRQRWIPAEKKGLSNLMRCDLRSR